MRVIIESGNVRTTYDNVTVMEEHDIKLALSGAAFTRLEYLAAESIGYSDDVGACLCTSFRYDTHTNQCRDCGHEAHNSRHYCGGLR